MRGLPLFLMLCATLASSVPLRAEGADTRPDTSEVFATRHYFLLELPQKVWDVLIYPLGWFTIYAERTELPQRARDWFTNQDHTFGFFPYVQFGGETSTGAGFSTFHSDLFGRRKKFSASYIFSHSHRQTAQAVYRDPRLFGSRFYWRMEGNFLESDDEDATINGAVVEEEKDAEEREIHFPRFRIDRIDLTSVLGWRPHAGELEKYEKQVYVEGRIGFGRRKLRSDREGRPLPAPGSTAHANRFSGFGKTLSFFSFGGRIAYDDRDYKPPVSQVSHPLNYVLPGRVLLLVHDLYYSYRDLSYPERGGLVQIEADLAVGPDHVEFWRMGAEIQRFFTLFWRNRILALRARLDQVHSLGDDSIVPYADLPTLGGGLRLRGYERGRFRGEGALLLSAEYRYPIWDHCSAAVRAANAYLFWDEGQVFDEYGQIDLDAFRTSFGAGINVRTEKSLLVGFRVGHSAEKKALVGFSLEQEF